MQLWKKRAGYVWCVGILDFAGWVTLLWFRDPVAGPGAGWLQACVWRPLGPGLICDVSSWEDQYLRRLVQWRWQDSDSLFSPNINFSDRKERKAHPSSLPGYLSGAQCQRPVWSF